jgi:TolA-binding protein
MDRQHRRDLKHDRFVDEIGTLSTRARENQRLLAAIAGALVLLSIAAYGIYFYRSGREKKAQDALARAIETIESPLMPPAGSPPVPDAKYKTDAERVTAAEKLFRDVQKTYSGSDAADVADLYLARVASGKSNTAEARKLLEDFVKKHADHVLVGAAKYSLYQLRLEGGEAQQVIAELNAEMGKPEPALPADSLLVVLAHAYEVQGNSDQAKATYRRIITEFPDSPYALEAQRRVGPA